MTVRKEREIVAVKSGKVARARSVSYHAVDGNVVVMQGHTGGPRVAPVDRVVQVGVGRHSALTGETGKGNFKKRCSPLDWYLLQQP